MRILPRVRWLALALMIVFGLVFAGLHWEATGVFAQLGEALGHIATKIAALSAGLLAVAKIIQELLRVVGVQADDPMVFTQGRAAKEPGGFWERVL